MESIGSIIRTAREEKGYSIEQVARETNIAKRYIVALESEDVEAFPGETYFIGFLRNYAEFLGEDPDRLIGIFRNMKIQEQPPPMEELLTTRKRKGLPVIIAAVAVLAVLGVIFWFRILPGMEERSTLAAAGEPAAAEAPVPAAQPDPSAPVAAGSRYDFKDEILERSFLSGDTIVIYSAGGQFPLTVGDIGETVTLDGGSGPLELKPEVSSLLDLNGDGVNDVKILLRRILDDRSSVVLYLDKYVESADPLAHTPDEIAPAAAAATPEPAPAAVPATSAVIGTASVASRASREVVLLVADQPESFDLDVVFRGLCLLRYVSDANTREERYFHKSEVFKLEASREMRLWISNAGSFTGKIRGVDVPLGNPGEVATKLIRWEKDNGTGKYQLKLIPVY